MISVFAKKEREKMASSGLAFGRDKDGLLLLFLQNASLLCGRAECPGPARPGAAWPDPARPGPTSSVLTTV